MRDTTDISARNEYVFPATATNSKSIFPLVFYTLSVIVVCLTGFNFYLFCWLWSSLSSTSENVGSSLIRSSQWPPMDAISSWDSIKFNGRLTSLQELQVDQILATEALHQEGGILISSKNSVQIYHQKEPLIELMAKESRIQMPAGLEVIGTNVKEDSGKKARMRLSCDPKTAHCLVDSPRVQLSHRRGVDFARKSLQTPRVITSRLHSSTKWLNLFSKNSSSFESRAGSIELTALDELLLFSHNSAVILDAETIDVSRIGGLSGDLLNGTTTSSRGDSVQRKSLDGKYKLCICLPAEPVAKQASSTREHEWNVAGFKGREKRKRLGLVFAIKPQLNCSRFSASFCNKSLQ